MTIIGFLIKHTTFKKGCAKALLKKCRKTFTHKLDTHKLLKNTINFNNLLNNLLNTHEFNNLLNELIKNINLIFEMVKQSNPETEYNYFIAGARSWNRFFKDFYDLDIISEYEKSSIHNINTDLYYFNFYNIY